MPEHANIFLDHMERGAKESGRNLADIDIQVGGSFELGEDVERMVEERKPAMAFTLGAMGSAKTNFLGTEEMIRERLAAFRKAGVTTLRVATKGESWKEKTESLEQAMDLLARHNRLKKG